MTDAEVALLMERVSVLETRQYIILRLLYLLIAINLGAGGILVYGVV